VADEWKVPHGGAARGTDASWAIAQPEFSLIDLYSGRSILAKTTDAAAASLSSQGPIWALTDLATAGRLGLTPASIENANGDFVRPTPESMLAAVKAMTKNEDGVLIPNVGATAPAGEVQPYPLTFVIYAMAPAEPLREDDCSARADSQKVLKDWLSYVTGRGQDHLADGFLKAPAALNTQAKDALVDVGNSPVTGDCAPVVSSTAATSTTVPTNDDTSRTLIESSAGSTSNATVPYVSPSVRAGTINSLLSNPEPSASRAQPAVIETITKSMPIPAFVRVHGLGWFGVLVGLVGIVGLMSLAAALSARQDSGFVRSRGRAFNPGRLAAVLAMWVGAVLLVLPLVIYQLGPVSHQRSQHSMLSSYRNQVKNAANEASGLGGVTVPKKAPESGAAVGIVEIGALHVQQVAVEGVKSEQTKDGPGHVPGTAGFGQPGNSVIVTRHSAYGASLGDITRLVKDNRILVTTTQGQSVYVVSKVGRTRLGSETKRDKVYGPSADDRLTLITSSTASPFNQTSAVVVTAKLATEPFAPTPQGGRTDSATGRTGDSGSWAEALLAVLAFAGIALGSVSVYRGMQPRVAYVLTLAPLVALTIVLAESVSRLLPAWA